MIHPTAIIDNSAEIGEGVEIGPFCVVEAGVTIGPGCRLDSRVVVKSGVVMGEENEIGEGSILGGRAQHIANPAEGGTISIGDRNKFRENVTVHRAFKLGDITRIGSNNMFMVAVHIAHDCVIGNQAIIVNNVLLAGHVRVDDRAFVSGAVGIHQFCRIGAFAMVGGHAKIVKDVPPYVTVDGFNASVVGLNKVGLRRAGFTPAQLLELKEAYRLIYRRGLRWTEVLEALQREFPTGPAAKFYEFFTTGKRGFCPERRIPKAATLKLANHFSDEESGEQKEAA